MLSLASIGWQEILVILLIVLLLFGAKKIPELMKSAGKGVKNFKDGLNGTDENTNETATKKPTNEAPNPEDNNAGDAR